MEELKAEKATFQFRGYLINNVSFKVKSRDLGTLLNLKIHPSAKLNREEGPSDVTLYVVINDDKENLEVKLDITGTFGHSGDLELGELAKFISYNAPAIMLPYVRAYVTNLTALSGMQAVIMPTMNTMNVGKQLYVNLQREYDFPYEELT